MKEENLNFLKGKLKIKEQIRKNYIHKERFYVQYDEFSKNRVENRLIKTTLEFLEKKSNFYKNRQKIKDFLILFDEVKTSYNIQADFSKVKTDRQIKEYKQILDWCKIFLNDKSFSLYKGKDLAFALLFDMNALFESYVRHKLAVKYENFNIFKGRGKYLVEKPEKFGLEPDIMVSNKENSEPIAIADTKWKIVKSLNDVSQADMYQLYAYGKKYGVRRLYLIYPLSSDKVQKIEKLVYEKGLILRVIFYNLNEDRICLSR